MNDRCDITGGMSRKRGRRHCQGIMKISGIYKIISKVNGYYYVGSSKEILGHCGRWRKHNWLLAHKKHHSRYLQRAWNKYGKDNFEFIIIEEIPNDQLLIVEQKYLDIAKKEKHKCYNMSFIAGRTEISDEMKRKISKANSGKNNGMYGSNQSGKNNPMFGRHLSEESKKQISNSMKGKNKGKNNPMYGKGHLIKGKKHQFFGKHHSEESKRKISESMKERLKSFGPNCKGGKSIL